MMENKDIRWKQRFQNFEKAFLFFNTAVNKESYTPIEVGGLVKAFEFTFELGWKTIKDYLYEQGLSTSYPREAIKEGFQTKIIEDGHTWLHMLEKRNELSHTYNDAVAEQAIEIIKHQYYPAIDQVYRFLKRKLMGNLSLGLKTDDLDVIIKEIGGLRAITKAAVFGSRAKGNYQKESDVDIVIWSENEHDALKLHGVLNDETLLPYKFDVINYYNIDNQDLKEHIDRRGVVIYQKP